MDKIEREEFDDLRGREFDTVDFDHCLFLSTDAREARFIDCEFTGSTLSSVKLDNAVLQVRFVDCKIEGINFFTAKRELLSLEFERCLIRYSSFAELKLKEIHFRECTLVQVDFADADLTQADFAGATFEDCTFRTTIIAKADFRGARGYSIDPRNNKVKGARFELPEVLGLLDSFDIKIGP